MGLQTSQVFIKSGIIHLLSHLINIPVPKYTLCNCFLGNSTVTVRFKKASKNILVKINAVLGKIY